MKSAKIEADNFKTPTAIKQPHEMSPKSKTIVEMVKDEDDTELNQWERNLRVNKFMIDLGIKKMIQTCIEPVFKSQQLLVEKIEQRMDGPLEDQN